MSVGLDGPVLDAWCPNFPVAATPTSGARRPGSGSGWSRRRQALAVACGVVALVLLALTLLTVASRPHVLRSSAPATGSRAHAISSSARALGQINGALGASVPAYAAVPADGGWRLTADGIPAHVGPRDLAVRLAGGSVTLRLTSIGRGTTMSEVGSVRSIEARGNRVVLDRGRVREWYAGGPLGVEQGFTIGAPPVGGSRELTLALRLGGTLRPIASRAGVALLTPGGRIALRYGGVFAVDGHGRALPSGLTLHGRVIRLWVDVRGATYPVRIDPLFQVGPKLAPDSSADGAFGHSVALTPDGTTAVIGSPGDDGGAGGAWVFTDSGGVWTQVGPELIGDCSGSCADQGTGETDGGHFGASVAISSSGDTIAIGASDDGAVSGTDVSTGHGAVWVFVRSGTGFTQQAMLKGQGEVGTGNLGASVAVSANGDTLLAGGPGNGATTTVETPETGAAWVFTRDSGGHWSQQAELVGDCTSSCANEGTGESGDGDFGSAVSISSDGDTVLIGGPSDGDVPNTNLVRSGAAWVFTSDSTGNWSQQGTVLANPVHQSYPTDFGASVALNGDSTALIGVPSDNSGAGGAYVFAPSGGNWTEQGSELTGTGRFGASVALSPDGASALIGSPSARSGDGEASLYSDSGGTWAFVSDLFGDCTASAQICQLEGSGEVGTGAFGSSVALSTGASAALVGGPADGASSSDLGAAWSFGPRAPEDLDPPLITGSLAVGGTLTCSTGTWENSPTGYTYRWDRGGVPIAGATSRTYSVIASDKGQKLTCTVTASNIGGTGTATSLGALVSDAGLAISPDSDPLLTGEQISATMTPPAQYAGQPGLTYAWNFGDGAHTSSSIQPMKHTFSHAGVFPVTVEVSDAGSEIAAASQNVVVVLTQPPTASFTILRAPVSSTNRAASTDVTQPVTIVPQASLPQEQATASDSIVREDFWLGGDGPPDPPDVTCLPGGLCSHYTGSALVPPTGLGHGYLGEFTTVPGEQDLGTGPLSSGGAQCLYNLGISGGPPRYVNFCQKQPTYSPTAGFGSFSVNFWNAALAEIGNSNLGFASKPGFASTPETPTLPGTACGGAGCGPDYGPIGYAPLANVYLQSIDGYQGEQGMPYTGCFPGYSFPDFGVNDPYANGDCEFITSYSSGLGWNIPEEPTSSGGGINTVRFGPYDLSHYGANSPQQLEDQWNFLYNYATVVGLDTPLAHQFGPATGATEGRNGSVNPRKVTMVAYDAEGVASAPVTQTIPLTPPSNPQLNFCMADVSTNSPCVTAPGKGGTQPFAITSGDTLRLKLNASPDAQDPILYYAISVGQPNTANVQEPQNIFHGKIVSDCSYPSDVGSWAGRVSNVPSSQSTGDSVGVGGGTTSSGGIVTIKAPATGPPNPHSVRASDLATTAVPSFGDLEDGAFAPHDCQAYADRTVNAAAPPGPLPKSGPNSSLQSAADAAAKRDVRADERGHQSAAQGAVTNPSTGVANPVLITTNPNDLEFELPHPGTYSVSIAAYNEAGLGAVTRIDGLLAEPGRKAGRCETVQSATIDIAGHDLAFSGNCMTVIASGPHNDPDLYATTSVMEISGIPIAPSPGDAIVINPNTNQFYVEPCSIPDSDLTRDVNPCSNRPNGDLYLALGGGSNGAPGLAFISDFTTENAQWHFLPLTQGNLAPVGGGIPTNTVQGCGLYPGSGLTWQLTPGATYDGFSVVTTPCIALSTSGQSRVAFWDSLPPGFGNAASSQTASSQVLLYGSDVPAATDVSSHSFANVARAHHPKPVIAGSFPTAPGRFSNDSKTLPGFPKLPSCPPSTNLKSGLTIPQDTDMGPISLPAGASFCYIQKTGDFIGRVDVQFPDDLPLPINKVEIGVEIGQGRLIDAGGEVSSGTGIDLAPTPVLLKDLKFDIQTDPTVVAGAITAAVADIINITGGVIVDAYHHSATTPEVSVEGNADIEGIQFGNFAVDFTPQGIGMHVTISKDFGVGSIDINVKGAVGSNGEFYLTGGGHACLFYCLGVNGLVSSYGLAACGSISLLAFTFSGGIGVAWRGPDTGVHLFLGCDLQPYIPPSLSDIPGQATDRAGALNRALSHPTKLPVLAPGSSPACKAAGDSVQPAGCLSLHQDGMCPAAHPKRAGCTSAVVAVQVHSLVSQEAPGATPLVTLTGPAGDKRTFTTPAAPGYYGFDGVAAMSGGTRDPGQTMESSALVDQNPVPVDDLVSTSSAYCRADAGATFNTTASSCPKVTTTTIFVEDPGPGEWKLSVAADSPPVVDYAVAQQQPPVSPTQFNPAVERVTLTGSATNYTVRIGHRSFSSNLLRTDHLLFAPSLMRISGLAGTARADGFGLGETAGELDVPAADESSLRGLILKLPTKFHGTVAVLDEGTAGGQPASQVLTPALKPRSVPAGGLPVVFEPMLDAGSHQKLVAFLSDSDGIPSRVLTLSSFSAPAPAAPSSPKIVGVLHDGSVLKVYFDLGDASVDDGINLALTEPDGIEFQQSVPGSQLRRIGSLHGIGRALQAREYWVEIPNVDPSESLKVDLDTVNDGLLSRPSRVVAAPVFVHAFSFSRLHSLIVERLASHRPLYLIGPSAIHIRPGGPL